MVVLVSNHVLSGALVGLAAPGPVSAFTAGVASHLALDAVPHWGGPPIADVMPIAVTDGLTGLSLIAAIAAKTPRTRLLNVLAGIAGACVLDLDKPSIVFFGRSPFPPAIDDFHGRIQRESENRMPQEITVATGLALVVAGALRKASSTR